MCDHQQGGSSNQEDSELCHADDDRECFNELLAETSSIASSDCNSFAWSEQGTITAVRVRPMSALEKKSNYRAIVDMSSSVIRIVNPTALHVSTRSTAQSKESTSATASATCAAHFTQEFRFDYNYWSLDHSSARNAATQSTIYSELGVLALQTILQGHDCSIFAYGQAGAGKTYTMMGSSRERSSLTAPVRANNNGSSCSSNAGSSSTLAASERRGLIPRLCQDLLTEMDERKSSGFACAITMSYVEIRDERVYDLLSQPSLKTSLKVREHPEEGAFVERAQRVHVTSYKQILELLEEGNRSRTRTSTSNTVRSHPSRPHTVLFLSIAQNAPVDHESMASRSRNLEIARKSRICLVDLASSERVDHSGEGGPRPREAANVNRSLAALADVLGALARRKCNGFDDTSQHQQTFVPYRNSVLTKLLKKGLGGRAKTIMIGAISPCCAHYEESIATLRYIERTRSAYTTARTQVHVSGSFPKKRLSDVVKLKSILCASKEMGVPSTIDGGDPEHPDECLGCEVCEQRSTNDNAAAIADQITIRNKTRNAIAGYEQKPIAACGDRKQDEQSARLMPRKSLHLLNLIAIRRSWETLHKYRALAQWKKLVPVMADAVNEPQPMLEIGKCIESKFAPFRKAGCPPLHTHTSTPETRTIVAPAKDVVAAVVTTDAICSSVVQEFLFPRQTNAKVACGQQSSTGASSSLLELLACCSEFDRSEFRSDRRENRSKSERHLTDDWCHAEVKCSQISLPIATKTLQSEDIVLPLSSAQLRDKCSTMHSALSLCVNSIDMARRALDSSMHTRRPVVETGIEFELLGYLDKRFIVIARRLVDMMATMVAQPDAEISSRSCCGLLAELVDDYCWQIIVRLCDQLTSASDSRIAGRIRLEEHLEKFADRLKQQLVQIPDMARSGNDLGANERVGAVLFVTTELLVMTERIKAVWSLARQKKRGQVLPEVAAMNDRNVATRSAKLSILIREALSIAEVRTSEFNEADDAKDKDQRQLTNDVADEGSSTRKELVTSLMRANVKLQSALTQTSQADNDSIQYLTTIANLERNLFESQRQLESRQMHVEDLASRHAALMECNSAQADKILALTRCASVDKQRLQELELQLAAIKEDRDERMLLLSQTEDALASALVREKRLRTQPLVPPAVEVEDTNCSRDDLHKATIKVASLQEKSTALLGRSTLLRATPREINSQVLARQSAAQLPIVERQQERECRGSMTVLEQSIERDYRDTIRCLEAQVKTLSTESNALKDFVAARTNEVDELKKAHGAAKAQIQELAKQVKLSKSFHQGISRQNLQESACRWIQCGLERACIKQLNSQLMEKKETCMMQLADAESFRCQDDNEHFLRQVIDDGKVVVSERLDSLDIRLDEGISDNDAVIANNTQVLERVQDEQNCLRSSLLKTLTDLSALTNELLVVCESASDSGPQASSASTEAAHCVQLDTRCRQTLQ